MPDAPSPPATGSSAPDAAGWRLESSYAELPPLFHQATLPTPVREPRLVIFNRDLARSLGLDPEALDHTAGARIFAGNALPEGAEPLAQAYAGHQFGHFTTLGDGRAILLGEQLTPDGDRFDIQLKGSGITRFSRGGDGRAALGPMLREYLVSEAMHALGIPTTRSLAVAATGEVVLRQDGPLPGAVLTRVAASHLRVGTFQWALLRGGEPELRALTDYTLRRHYPDEAEAANPPLALLQAVIERQAELVARWMAVGFIHGVMNTDNVALSGETIDYGPCAFMDHYDPETVFSSIDRQGRYAYANQPAIAQWNLARFAETLLPLFDPEEKTAVEMGTEAVRRFPDRFECHWLAAMRRKLGLFNGEPGDAELIQGLLDWMHGAKADFTNTFASLADEIGGDACHNDPDFRQWHEAWQARLARQPQSPAEHTELLRASNPAFIPRNHLVEAALAAATDGDLTPFRRFLEILRQPFAHDLQAPEFRRPDPAGGVGYRTFCGT